MLSKGCYFTDIHFGRKSNCQKHNQDCLNFIDWFCEQAVINKCDYIAFLGDWHESRTSIDISTLKYSYMGAKKLNDLGIPVYFLIGNHDLGMRDSRELYSTIPFHEFNNFILVHNEPLVVPLIKNTMLFVPFIMKDEYESLSQYTHIPVWAGHFEFKDFILTGYNVKMEHGPDISQFDDVEYILSGHFHKRQSRNNTYYIGNAFPMDFGDANDFNRGLAIFDHTITKHNIKYINWNECPRYLRIKLSEFDIEQIKNICHIDLVIDTNISFEQLTQIEQDIRQRADVRSLNFDESSKFIVDNDPEEFEQYDVTQITTNDLIIKSLQDVDSSTINKSILIDLYRNA